MKPRDHGTIIQIGSALAYGSIPLQSAYCGAKHAIKGFLDSLRSELIHDGSNVRLSMVQLPAVNTPQFDWARSHMPYRARPMGKIFQPEDIGRAIVHVAENPRREYWLGGSAMEAILGNFLVPQYADRYLAQTAVEGQQTSEPDRPGRPDNLFEPVNGLHRMRGRFGLPRHHLRLTSSGGTARIATVAAGSALAVGLGMLAGTALWLPGRVENFAVSPEHPEGGRPPPTACSSACPALRRWAGGAGTSGCKARVTVPARQAE